MNEKKLNICIYANCQSWGLRYFINKYIPNWNVHIMLNYQYIYFKKNIDYEKLKDIDIFIYQPLNSIYKKYSTDIKSKESIVNYLKKDCIKISFPYIYNDSFWCLTRKEWDSENLNITNINKYHNEEIIHNLIDNNNNLEKIVNLFNQGKINFCFEQRYNNCMNILEKKECLCDLKVTKFIKENFRKYKLFLTKNHPTTKLFEYLFQELLSFLKINIKTNEEKTDINICNLPGNQPHSIYDKNFFNFKFNEKFNNNDYYTKVIAEIYRKYKKKRQYRVAVMLIGQKRCYEDIKKNIEENLITYLEQQNVIVDVFIHSDEDYDIKNKKNINTSKLIIDEKNKLTNVFNVTMYQIYRNKYCYDDIKIHMKKNNIEYDFIIKTRPDLIIFKDGIPPIDRWDINRINGRVRLYPKLLPPKYIAVFYTKGELTLDDQFFIVPKKLADKAFLLKHGSYEQKCKLNWGESVQTKLWNSHNIKFNIIPINAIIYSWKFSHENVYNNYINNKTIIYKNVAN